MRQYGVTTQVPRIFWAPTTLTTTLNFQSLFEAESFIQKIPTTAFGPNAELSIFSPDTPKPRPQRNKEISVVMKGVALEIPISDLAEEFNHQKLKVTRLHRIISAATNKETPLIRIFVEDSATAEQLLAGIHIMGRNYQVEPSRETTFHRPCLNCAKFGHTATNCTANKVCFSCGKNPQLCLHKSTDNLKFCATCMSDTHYTGQARCPQFPKSDAANEPTTHIPIQPLPTPASIKKPSEIFPALPTTMNYAKAATNGISQAGTTTTEVPQNDNLDSNTTSSTQTVPKSEIAKYITEALVIAENYIEKRLNEIQEQLAIFTVSMLTTNSKPTLRKTTLKTANQSARRVFHKRMIHHFVNNQIKISLQPLQEQLTSLANSITNIDC